MSFVCIMRPKVTMSIYNTTVFMPSEFTLIGIPGLESVQCWVGIPFCAMYLMAMIGNSLLLIIIKSEHSLYQPMYIFLGMLGVTDIALSTSIVPKCLESSGFMYQKYILIVACFKCGSSTHFRA